MKKTILKATIIIFLSVSIVNAKAQNSIDLRWGNFIPLNNKMKDGFTNRNAFSIGILHPLQNNRFYAGLTYSHQQYESKDGYFGHTYRTSLIIHHYLLTSRYDIIRQNDFIVYTSIDAGLNKSRSNETKNGIPAEVINNGLSAGLSFGADVKVSDRILLGVNLQCLYSHANLLEFNNEFSIQNVTAMGGNIGMKILLYKYRNEKD
jgi:hypothetical protein